MTDFNSWPSSRKENGEQRLTLGAMGLPPADVVVGEGTWSSLSEVFFDPMPAAASDWRIRSQKLAFSCFGTSPSDFDEPGSGSLFSKGLLSRGSSVLVKGVGWGFALVVGDWMGLTSKPILSRCSLGFAITMAHSLSGTASSIGLAFPSGLRERFSFIK
ncbi:AAEL001663-PA [Aedes aegypti]|uniref:AAEL001663-PA n=1 Tax=Aedes aegypti TaxID=7159 RepID=Q17KI8_AEDAE|nr:AAEL001663-PA [Aedes aegypti]